MNFDLSSLTAALPRPAPPTAGRPPPVPPLKLTVLSWNIDGLNTKGMAECRNREVPAVIDNVKPHVMLLQEIPTREILTRICNNRYSSTATSSDARKEAAVVYIRNDFKYLPQQSIQQIAGQHLPNVDQQKVELLCKRTATVRLQHRIGRNTFLFFSFHNINNIGPQNNTTPKEMATLFCTLVQNVAETERYTQVVCGADFNYCRDGFFEGMGCVPITNVPHTLVRHDDIRRRVRVPDYVPTDRRKYKDKIDYFVLGNIAINNGPTALDITKYHYIPDSSVPHDPLVYVWTQPTETTD